ncbi:hypothetical protein FRB90_001955 [Tulasnella sp. 427]|nr:hypothetical protein FRB90_001955 [Tulasnella sp. 427]
MEERNPARVLKFSPAGSGKDMLVFTESSPSILQDSTRFHVVDGQSFDEHLVVAVPKASPGFEVLPSRRNVNPEWSSPQQIYDSDEDMENAEAMSTSRHSTSQPPTSSSWPSRGTALSAFSDGTPNLAGLAFDPTGGWLYVGSDTGVFEWELGRENRIWNRGYVNWA